MNKLLKLQTFLNWFLGPWSNDKAAQWQGFTKQSSTDERMAEWIVNQIMAGVDDFNWNAICRQSD